jgi:hypothetical protein
MLRESKYYCPECDDGRDHDYIPSRRQFLRAMGGAAALATVGSASLLRGDDAKAEPKPAEGMIRELYATLNDEQKKTLVRPYDDKAESGMLTRQMTFNAPIDRKRIADNYTKPQQDLLKQIVRSMLASDDAVERISRGGKWDNSGSFEGCGATIFGEPGDNAKFAFVFAGHHLTLRCDGNSQPGAAWGGPIYYGHSADGYSRGNVYYYQTETVHSVFASLNEEQMGKALNPQNKNPGDGLGGLKEQNPRQGIAYAELKDDQKQLVEKVMRTLLEPFRKEDGDEVMSIIKANGGMEQIHLGFYQDEEMQDKKSRWSFWRLEGPGFVWNYRPLPHVHCFVNIVNA